MIVPRALWLFPSALAVEWDFVTNYVSQDQEPEGCRRLEHFETRGTYFYVPESAFKGQMSTALDNDAYRADDERVYSFDKVSSGCDANALKIIAQYMTAASFVADETNNHRDHKTIVGETVELFEKVIAADKDAVTAKTALAAADAFFGEHATTNGNKTYWGDLTNRITYDELVSKTHIAEAAANVAANSVDKIHDKMVDLVGRTQVISDGLQGVQFSDACIQGLDAYGKDRIVSKEFNECMSRLKEFHSRLSSTVETQSSVFEAPQKPLSGNPKPKGIFGNLEFFEWGEAKFDALLDLQKCVNFVNPASYAEGDHLLDLVTAKVAHVLPALKLENLPKIRAMLNIGLDLTSDDWDKAVANMSAADKAKPAAQYKWQQDETFRIFWALYGAWAETQEGNAEARIRKLALPEPKKKSNDLDQIMS